MASFPSTRWSLVERAGRGESQAGEARVALQELCQAYWAALYAYAFWTNGIFMAMHVLIGVVFMPRAFRLVRGMREARKRGDTMPRPLVHDAIDP